MLNFWRIWFLILLCAISTCLLMSSFNQLWIEVKLFLAFVVDILNLEFFFQAIMNTGADSAQIQNQELIKKLHGDICHLHQPNFDLTHPHTKFSDISLVVTINYDSLLKVIPLVEVSLQVL